MLHTVYEYGMRLVLALYVENTSKSSITGNDITKDRRYLFTMTPCYIAEEHHTHLVRAP